MKKILVSCLLLLGLTTSAHAAYTIPHPIPDGQGANGVFAQQWKDFIVRFDQACPTRPVDWSTSQAGYYYVDYDHPSATDAVTNGNTTTPRKTLPPSPTPGAYVEMGPGEYFQDHSVFGPNGLVWIGDANNIICLVGATGSSIQTEFGFRDSAYVTIDNITHDFDNATQGGDSGTFELYGAAFFVVRNSEFTSDTIDCGDEVVQLDCGGGIGIGMWSGVSQYVAFLDNQIHAIGEADFISTGEVDPDRHCVKISYGVFYLWFLNNDVYDCGGDSVQIESRDANNVGTPAAARYLFFAGNDFHHNRQTGFWVKYGMDIIFAHNLVYNMTNGGTGEPSCAGGQYLPVYVWYLYNEFALCKNGVQTSTFDSATASTPLFIIGNLFHAGTALAEVPNAGGHCAMAIWGGSSVVAAWNTVYDWPQGYCEPDQHNYGIRYVINNIFANMGYASGESHIWISGDYAASHGAIVNNVHELNYRQNINGAITTVTNPLVTSTIKIVASAGMNNPAGGNYGLADGSAAIDFNTVPLTGLSTSFEARYGERLDLDYIGNSRFNGRTDAGILEKGGTPPPPPPPPPTNPSIAGQDKKYISRLTHRRGL